MWIFFFPLGEALPMKIGVNLILTCRVLFELLLPHNFWLFGFDVGELLILHSQYTDAYIINEFSKFSEK